MTETADKLKILIGKNLDKFGDYPDYTESVCASNFSSQPKMRDVIEPTRTHGKRLIEKIIRTRRLLLCNGASSAINTGEILLSTQRGGKGKVHMLSSIMENSIVIEYPGRKATVGVDYIYLPKYSYVLFCS